MEADQHMFKTVQRKIDEPHRPRRYNDMKSTSKQVSTVNLTKFRKDFVSWSCIKWDTIAQIKKSYNQLHFTIVNKFKIWYCKLWIIMVKIMVLYIYRKYGTLIYSGINMEPYEKLWTLIYHVKHMVFNSRIYHEELLKTMVLYQIISYYSKSYMFDY